MDLTRDFLKALGKKSRLQIVGQSCDSPLGFCFALGRRRGCLGQFCPVQGYLQAVLTLVCSLDLGRQWEQGSAACTAVPYPSCPC